MNSKTKKRMFVVTGFIVMVLVVVLAVVGGSMAAKTVTVADALSGKYASERIQVSGNVVENSFSTSDNVLTFRMYDSSESADPNAQLAVRYEGGVAATFGNDVTAICTGTLDEDGTLVATELVTKCPSKYENATDALDVSRLLSYGDSIVGKPVKVSGLVKEGTLTAAGQGDRMVLVSAEDGSEISILFNGALPEEVVDGAALVIGGSLDNQGKFVATDVALQA